MPDPFEQFAIVELFGHSRIAGKVTEQIIGGQGFIRVEVPELPARGHSMAATPGFTRFYGPGAIYAITPVDEALMIAAADSMRVAPVNIYLATPLLRQMNGEEDDDEDRDLRDR